MFLNTVIPVPQQPDGFFYRIFLSWLEPTGNVFPMVYPIIAFVLLFTQAITLNKVISSQRLLNKPCYLVAMSYLLITSLFSEWYHLSAPLIINSLLIWVFSELCKLQNIQNPKSILFNIGIVTGLATFLYFPSIAFLLLIIVGLTITRPFKLPEWLMVFFGLLTPYYFMFSWLYLKGNLMEYRLPEIGVTIPTLSGSTWAYVAIILLAITLLIGVFFIQINMRRQLLQVRKCWGLVFLYLLVSLFVPFLNETDNFDYWILAAIPVSIISSAAFLYPERKWFAIFIHWGLVALIIVMQYL